jgi:leucyl aminopeptidase (aminopeptidase T)
MSDPISAASADRLARAVLRGRLDLRAKERLTIEAYPSSLPWVGGFVREARRLGAYPLVHYEDEAAYWDAAEHGRAKAIGTLAEHERALLDASDAYVYFWGPEDVGRLRRLPAASQQAVFAFNMDWYRRASKAGVRGARMGIARATEANARQFGADLDTWRAQLWAASVRDPKEYASTAARLERGLGASGEVRLTHRNGTDLTLALAKRPVQKDLGVLAPPKQRGQFGIMVNVPPGSVYVSVDESTADGTLVANRRTTQGSVLEGGRWTFRGGRLTRARYARGQADFDRRFREGTGAKNRPAFLEVGVSPDLHATPMLEENELGAVTVGIGNNAAFGGKNRSSIFEFLTLAGATLTVGGRPLVWGGRVV